jgi:hypothetical protein
MRKVHLWISLIVGVLVWGAYFAHFIKTPTGWSGGFWAPWP